MAVEKTPKGASCGCGCMGCGCLSSLLAALLLLVLGGVGWLYRDEALIWLGRDAPKQVSGLVGDLVRYQAARPFELPPLTQGPEAASEIRKKIQADWQSQASAPVRQLSLTQEELNLYLRSWVRDPAAGPLAQGIHDLHVQLGTGRVDLRASLYGGKLAGWIPQDQLPPALRKIVEGAEFVNLELGSEMVPGEDGAVALRPDRFRLLGLPFPVSLLRSLATPYLGTALESGLSIPGVRGLEAGGDKLQLRVDPSAFRFPGS